MFGAPRVHKFGPETQSGDPSRERLCARESHRDCHLFADCWGFAMPGLYSLLFRSDWHLRPDLVGSPAEIPLLTGKRYRDLSNIWAQRITTPFFIWHLFRWIYWGGDVEANREFSRRYQGIRFPDTSRNGNGFRAYLSVC